MERPTCATCQYWAGIDRQPVFDECRRKPPTILGEVTSAELETTDVFPITTGGMWCGEHPDFREYIESSKIERQINTF